MRLPYLLYSLSTAVFLVSTSSRTQVYPFSKCYSSGFEAQQSLVKCKLWFKNLWFWSCSSNLREWVHDRVCCHKMVPSPWVVIELIWLHCCNRCVVCWLYIYGAYEQKASVPRKRSRASDALIDRGELKFSTWS